MTMMQDKSSVLQEHFEALWKRLAKLPQSVDIACRMRALANQMDDLYETVNGLSKELDSDGTLYATDQEKSRIRDEIEREEHFLRRVLPVLTAFSVGYQPHHQRGLTSLDEEGRSLQQETPDTTP